MARRTMAACSSRRPAYRSPSSWSSRVDPSMSVNRKVTVPVGSSAICAGNVARPELANIRSDGGPIGLCWLVSREGPDRWEDEVLLENKTAVVYGGGGSVGGAVARAFARERAHVFLTGRTSAALDAVAEDISDAGGRAESASLDALDEDAVDPHTVAVAENTGATVSASSASERPESPKRCRTPVRWFRTTERRAG